MDGLVILSTITSSHYALWVIVLSFFVNIPLCCYLIYAFSKGEWRNLLVCLLITIIFNFGTYLIGPRVPENTYYGYLEQNVDLYKFYAKYEVVDIQDNLLILRDR